MDSRAKQRLTGAVILVALFVLLVPELLTGPRGADAPAGAPTDEGMRRYTIDLDAATSAVPAADSQTAQPAVSLPPVAPAADPANEAMPRAQPGESAAPAVRGAQEQPEAAPAAAPNPVAAAPTPAAPAPAPATAARAETPRAATASARGSFVVQLGSFGSRDNADRLVREMTGKGFAAFVAPIKSGGRELYRVRVGPTPDRAGAEALAAQLRRAGQSGSIVPIS